jgi:hypothetical protein
MSRQYILKYKMCSGGAREYCTSYNVLCWSVIKPGLQYDHYLGMTVGQPTLKNASGSYDKHATHALVFMLAGVSSRWKQTVAYEFTGNSCCSSEVPNRIMTVIKKSHEIGLTIRTLKSEMGPQNRGVWRLLNINDHKQSKINNSIPHPCMENEKVFVMPDAVHVFKNVADSLTCGHRFYLDQRTVGA